MFYYGLDWFRTRKKSKRELLNKMFADVPQKVFGDFFIHK